MFKKNNGRVIPSKNYLYLGLILLFSLMIVYYFYMWYSSYKASLLEVSIIDDYLDVIQFNELDNYIMENKDAVIYVSVLGDEKINDFEMKFVNTISENSLRDTMLYMDVSEVDKSDVDSKFGTDGQYPYIVVYTDGKLSSEYLIADKKYDTKKIVKYLNRIGVTMDD